MPRTPAGAVHDADPNMRTIREGTWSLRSADIRSGIEAYSRKVPSRASSIIENWVARLGDRMGKCRQEISRRAESLATCLTLGSQARVVLWNTVNNELNDLGRDSTSALVSP